MKGVGGGKDGKTWLKCSMYVLNSQKNLKLSKCRSRGCSSGLAGMHESLDSIPSTTLKDYF